MEEKKTKKKMRLWKRLAIIFTVLLIAVGVGVYVYTHMEYKHIQVIKNYETKTNGNGKYISFADGILEYSKDGIALLTKKGEEIWNQPCQMGNPMAQVCKEAAVVADKGGTAIYVFQKSGLKGEIKTTRPIERISVSEQGVVAAILQNEETPMIMCYDAKGNVLVEHKASFKNTGYPVDLAISENGQTLVVSYLGTKGTGISTKVIYYYFGGEEKEKKDYEVLHKEYLDSIAPKTIFLNQKTSLIVMDNALVFNEGLKNPKEVATVKVKREIESVAYNEKYVALLLKNSGESGCELQLYQTSGKQKMNVKLEGEYTSIKLIDEQVVLSDGNKCVIYRTDGVRKFAGDLEMNVLDICPIMGMNKYMIITAKGFQEIRLIK